MQPLGIILEKLRFIVYFDLLGFTNLINTNSVGSVLLVFDKLFRALLHSWYTHADRLVRESVIHGYFDELKDSTFWIQYEKIGRLLSSAKLFDSKSELDSILSLLFPFKFLVLSDSLLFVSEEVKSKEERLAGLEIATGIAREFLVEGFKYGIPMRGAISFGEAHVDSQRDVFFGKAIIEAIQLEQSQEWIGCSFTENASNLLLEYKDVYEQQKAPWRWKMTHFGSLSRHSVHKYLVPLKNKENSEKLIINWAGGTIGSIKIHRGMFEKVLTGNPKHDVKWENTYLYLKWWDDLLENSLKNGKLVL